MRAAQLHQEGKVYLINDYKAHIDDTSHSPTVTEPCLPIFSDTKFGITLAMEM